MSKDGRTDPMEPGHARFMLRSRKIRIEVVQGPDMGRSVEFPAPSVSIGSGREGCDFALTDPTVSRVHLHLRVEKDALRVIDADSRNGTSIDGTAVRDAYARPDSLLVIGNTTLRLRMLSSVVEVPLSPHDHFGEMLGQSIAMRHVFTVLERSAATLETVLIEGETGTGKELVARGLHAASPCADGPFETFDCSAVSSSLIESKLFGHMKGSFTGAIADHPGIFEAADGGTLFLDELGELPLELQPKLLRALERGEVCRLGSNVFRKVKVRIVAATNRSLSREIDRNRFREDLYYRLAVITVRLPPLRERLEDIPRLVRHFEEKLNLERPASPLPDSVVKELCTRTWPGNVRELLNVVRRMRTLGQGASPEEQAVPAPAPGALGVTLAEPLLTGRQRIAEAYEREYIELALRETGGNISRAAALAKVGRKFFQQAMKRYGLRGDSEE